MEGNIVFDQDGVAPDAPVDLGPEHDHQDQVTVEPSDRPGGTGRSGARIPRIVSTPPSRGGPGPGHAHLPRPTRRERKARRKQRIRQRRTVVGRHPKSTVALVILLLLTPIWISLGSAATNQALGNTVGARLTEWVRDHGGGGVVTWAENTWYTWHAPPKGGKPAKGAIPAPLRSTTTTQPSGPAHLPVPAAITPFVATPTPGEGQWRPMGRTVGGLSAMYAAYLRPNAVNTSLVTGVAWMDTKLLKTNLYEGSSIPGTGQTWANMAPITGTALDTLVAAFNSGFRMQDAQGGFYADGVTAVPLVAGRASLVINSDGTPTLGAWGTDVAMSPSVVAVRQNLDLIVNNGQPVAGLDANDNHRWGATLAGKVQVWRSGLGITADGALVFVGGSGLSIVDLANVLSRAGAVRAMEMDINTAWVNFFSYSPAPGQPASAAVGTKLTFDESNWPGRYFSPSSRDFITMSARSTAATPTGTHGTANSATR
ncbi:MAG TPA: phosphodiester glycosidase family protein [Acidimicrobiales bacterium]|nr:phosphodiester glycosidase family protein [Acidimicrobiales bacterium]